jgi:hypothetical protein
MLGLLVPSVPVAEGDSDSVAVLLPDSEIDSLMVLLVVRLAEVLEDSDWLMEAVAVVEPVPTVSLSVDEILSLKDVLTVVEAVAVSGGVRVALYVLLMVAVSEWLSDTDGDPSVALAVLDLELDSLVEAVMLLLSVAV